MGYVYLIRVKNFFCKKPSKNFTKVYNPNSSNLLSCKYVFEIEKVVFIKNSQATLLPHGQMQCLRKMLYADLCKTLQTRNSGRKRIQKTSITAQILCRLENYRQRWHRTDFWMHKSWPWNTQMQNSQKPSRNLPALSARGTFLNGRRALRWLRLQNGADNFFLRSSWKRKEKIS